MCQFRTFMSGVRGGLKDVKITELAPADTAVKPERALDDIFADVGVDCCAEEARRAGH